MPLSPGITTSSRTTSGLCARTSNTASRASAGLADYLQIALGGEQQPQTGADDRVVVDDDDADHASGTSATTVVPAAGIRLDDQPAVEQRQPLAHPREPDAAAPSRLRR